MAVQFVDSIMNVVATHLETAQRFLTERGPTILSALVLLVLGVLAAYFFRWLVVRLFSAFDGLFTRALKKTHVHAARVKHSYAYATSRLVFFVLIVVALDGSANVLGWAPLIYAFDVMTAFLPKVILGVFIVLFGYLASSFLRFYVSPDGEHTSVLGRAVQAGVLTIVLLLACENLGLHIELLNQLVLAIVAVAAGGVVLALCLGAKTLTANLIGAQYARRYCRPGEYIQVGNYGGRLVEITPTALLLDREKTLYVVPGALFQESVSQMSSGFAEDDV